MDAADRAASARGVVTPTRMRLRAIDAPEQSFSARAKPFTSERASRKIAHVEPTDRDRYGLSFAKPPSGRARRKVQRAMATIMCAPRPEA